MGIGNRSAIGTLVERSTRYTILLHLDGRRSAASVCDAVIAAMGVLPPPLCRALTWPRHRHPLQLGRRQWHPTPLGWPITPLTPTTRRQPSTQFGL